MEPEGLENGRYDNVLRTECRYTLQKVEKQKRERLKPVKMNEKNLVSSVVTPGCSNNAVHLQ